MQYHSLKNLSQDPERTADGIFAGAQRYIEELKEAHPEHNIAYDAATGQQRNAGILRSVKELQQSTCTEGRARFSQEFVGGGGVMDEITRQAVILSPAIPREYMREAYPGICPGLEKQTELEKIARQRAEMERKGERGEVSTLEHRGPVKQLLHTLHLDRHNRKHAKEQREMEGGDMTDNLLELSGISNRLSELVTGIIENYSQSHTEAEGERRVVYSHGERRPSTFTSVEETKVFKKEDKGYDGEAAETTEVKSYRAGAPLTGGAGDGKEGRRLSHKAGAPVTGGAGDGKEGRRLSLALLYGP